LVGFIEFDDVVMVWLYEWLVWMVVVDGLFEVVYCMFDSLVGLLLLAVIE